MSWENLELMSGSQIFVKGKFAPSFNRQMTHGEAGI